MAPSISEDERITKILNHLQAHGISRKQLRECLPEEIDNLVPHHLTDVDAFSLKVALRKEKSLYNRFFDVIGRVTVKKGEETQHGSCVLVGKDGLTITALHILLDNEQSKKTRKGKGKQEKANIIVVYPNTTCGKLSFRATLIDADPMLDLVLLKPMEPLTSNYDLVNYFSDWAVNPPLENNRAVLFAFPLVVDREFDLANSGVNDLPSMHEGKITLVPPSAGCEVLTDYLGFEGCSGGLVIFPDSDLGPSGFGIHLMSIHESDNMDNVDLKELNKIANHKGHYGVFSRGVYDFLKRSSGDSQPKGGKKSLILKGRNDRAIVNNIRKLASKGLTLEEILNTSAYAKLPTRKSTGPRIQPDRGKMTKDCYKEATCAPLQYIKIQIEKRKSRDLEPFDGGVEKQNGQGNKVEVLDVFGPWPGMDMICNTEHIGTDMGSMVQIKKGGKMSRGVVKRSARHCRNGLTQF